MKMNKFMKKIIAGMILTTVLMSLVACGNKKATETENSSKEKTTSEKESSEKESSEKETDINIEDYENVFEHKTEKGNIKSKQVFIHKVDSVLGTDERYCVEEVKYDKEGNILDTIIYNEDLLNEYKERNLNITQNSTYDYSVMESDDFDKTVYESIKITHYDENNELIKKTYYTYENGILLNAVEYWGEDGYTDDSVDVYYTYYNEEGDFSISNFKFATAILSNNNVYIDFNGEDWKLNQAYGEGACNKFFEDLEQSKIMHIDGYGEFYCYKLNVSDVKKVVGNGHEQGIESDYPYYGVFILHNDNTVSFCSLKSIVEGKAEIKKLSIENVVDIVDISCGFTTVRFFVDENGKLIDSRDNME